MKFVFAILKLRPMGGKERDFVGLVEQFSKRGHTVTVATAEPSPAPLPRGVETIVLPISAWTNHGRHRAFAEAIQRLRETAGDDAIVIAFDRVPCADYLFVAGGPHQPSTAWKRFLPRHRQLTDLENAAFGPTSAPFAFFLTSDQAARYRARYGIGADRCAVLPTTFGVGRALPSVYYGSRTEVRKGLGIPDHAPVLIHVAVNGYLKGLDRVIDLLPYAPEAHLLIVGETGARFRLQARRRGVQSRVHVAGYATDVPRLLGAADLMVHPAREENTGTVILESLLYGVPAVVSAECGYAEHVLRAGAGAVVPSPFDQLALLAQVRAALEPARLEQLKAAARRHGLVLISEGGIEAVAETMLATIVARAAARRHETDASDARQAVR